MILEIAAVAYSDRLLLDHLASLAANGELVTLCYTEIASATGITLRTVQRSIPRLVQAGFITCERSGRGYPHTYKVNHHGNRSERESA
jgi:DNA-binding transcriptional ArsR family regulator